MFAEIALNKNDGFKYELLISYKENELTIRWYEPISESEMVDIVNCLTNMKQDQYEDCYYYDGIVLRFAHVYPDKIVFETEDAARILSTVMARLAAIKMED